MTDLKQAAQMALEALMKSHTHPLLPDDCEAAINALRAALAEPQTTHWEGCESVHPECKKENT